MHDPDDNFLWSLILNNIETSGKSEVLIKIIIIIIVLIILVISGQLFFKKDFESTDPCHFLKFPIYLIAIIEVFL